MLDFLTLFLRGRDIIGAKAYASVYETFHYYATQLFVLVKGQYRKGEEACA